jgi:hypothetical protein
MDPYQAGLIPKDLYHSRRAISGEIVAVMAKHLEGRNLFLIPQPTRALRTYELVELIATEEKPNEENRINSISYLGFFEVKQGGVVKNLDHIKINGKKIGSLLGYDETHMPNHLNMIIKMDKKHTGLELGIKVNDLIQIDTIS